MNSGDRETRLWAIFEDFRLHVAATPEIGVPTSGEDPPYTVHIVPDEYVKIGSQTFYFDYPLCGQYGRRRRLLTKNERNYTRICLVCARSAQAALEKISHGTEPVYLNGDG